MEGAISARTEKAQNSRYEEGFALARGGQCRNGKNGDIRTRPGLWLDFYIMSRGIELIEVIVNFFLKNIWPTDTKLIVGSRRHSCPILAINPLCFLFSED